MARSFRFDVFGRSTAFGCARAKLLAVDGYLQRPHGTALRTELRSARTHRFDKLHDRKHGNDLLPQDECVERHVALDGRAGRLGEYDPRQSRVSDRGSGAMVRASAEDL